MAKLVRYQRCGCFHFLTFSCFRRQALLTREGAYGAFERELEAVRVRYGFVVAGYVLMPEHVHLLVGEPRRSSLSVALQALKQQTSRKLKQRGEVQFWQRRYYDFNVHNEEKRVEKLRYMHRNPVKHRIGVDRATAGGRGGSAVVRPTLRQKRGEGWGTQICGRLTIKKAWGAPLANRI